LTPRGLIDVDSHPNWDEYLQQFTPDRPHGFDGNYACHPNRYDVETRLDGIEKDSRGYRFWHEIRVLRLKVK